MFVRIKRIKGNYYGYLVENSWTPSGPRQKVVRYLGKILRPERTKQAKLEEFIGEDVEKFVLAHSYPEIVQKMVDLEFSNHEFGAATVDFSESKVKVRDKPVVVALNEGFLCDETLKKALEYTGEDDYSGFQLADLLTGMGILVEKDVFVEVFQKMRGTIDRKNAEETDFYY